MLSEIIKKLIRQEDLSPTEANHAMTAIMTGNAGEACTASILTALAIKGETGPEVEAFARAMRHAALNWPGDQSEDVCDTCGTGGDGASSINISTLAALTLAALGLKVAKHGNRAVSSTTGSADLLEALGYPMNAPPEETLHILNRSGMCFLFAPAWHPAMKHAAPVRKSLGIRTVFNILGPLTNPAPISYQVVGVFGRTYLKQMAHALAGLRRKGAYVIHAEDGLDEVSPGSPTHFIRIADGNVAEEGQLTPEDFGFVTQSAAALRINDRDEGVRRVRAILAGQGSDLEKQTVAMNAALVLSMVRNQDLKSAAEECLTVLNTDKPLAVMEQWTTASL
ncbi:MAG: anthranilate phosphoribosyltransferase [Leptospiraceae bacterium]|nr:anthranilate phosphoribosyltransferase [Leptospiraceae bacterium]